MGSKNVLAVIGLLLVACSGSGESSAKGDAEMDRPASQIDTRPSIGETDGDGADQTSVTGTGPIVRDATRVRAVTITGASSYMPGYVRLLQADLTRASDGRFDVAALVSSRDPRCTTSWCGSTVTTTVALHLSAEQTAEVEGWLAQIPGVACHDDPGTMCDYDGVYSIGIDGPLQPQTCCKRDMWRQDWEVKHLHQYLEMLAVPLVDGTADGGVNADAAVDAPATDARCPPDLTAPLPRVSCPADWQPSGLKMSAETAAILSAAAGPTPVMIQVRGGAQICPLPVCSDRDVCPARDSVTSRWQAENLEAQRCVRDLITQVGGTSSPEVFWLVNSLTAELTWAQIQAVAPHPHVLSIELTMGGGPT